MDRQWSDEQKAIFGWFAGQRDERNLVVRARAGTGKTTTILEAIGGAPERRILLAAFNKVIAEELQGRLRNPRAEAKTLHALGFSYVRQAWPKLKVDGRRKWTLAKAVVPRHAPQSVLRTVAELHTKAREITPHVVENADSAIDALCELALEHELTLGEEEIEAGFTDAMVAGWAFEAMQHAMVRADAIDFADMIFLPLVHKWVAPRYDLVVVDEAQDMSGPQLELAQKACKKDGRIAVIGDDRQAIYGFRGADSGSIDRLKRALGALELGLKTTYRCPQDVVALAAEIVPDFVAAPTAPAGIVRKSDDPKDTLVRDAKPGDFVLSRTNAPLVPLCLALLKAGKLARIRGRDLSAGLRALTQQLQGRGAKDMDDLRIELRSYLERETAKLNKRADSGQIDQATAEAAIERAGDHCAVIAALTEGLVSFDELYARFDSLFTGDDNAATVMFSTVHRAKGLESERVWLLAKTFMATRRELAASDVGEGLWRRGVEEQNIRYVAITRSKHELIWLHGDFE